MSTTTDQIISAGIELGEQIAGNVSNWREQEQAMRDLIAAALEEARREGVAAMREAAAKLARKVPLHYGSGEPADEELAQAIEDLPLPTGERHAVLLTDEQVQHVAHTVSNLFIGGGGLAANGLEVRK